MADESSFLERIERLIAQGQATEAIKQVRQELDKDSALIRLLLNDSALRGLLFELYATGDESKRKSHNNSHPESLHVIAQRIQEHLLRQRHVYSRNIPFFRYAVKRMLMRDLNRGHNRQVFVPIDYRRIDPASLETYKDESLSTTSATEATLEKLRTLKQRLLPSE